MILRKMRVICEYNSLIYKIKYNRMAQKIMQPAAKIYFNHENFCRKIYYYVCFYNKMAQNSSAY